MSCWTSTLALGLSSEVASPVLCPSQPDLPVVIGPATKPECPPCNHSVYIYSLTRENVLAKLIGPEGKRQTNKT